MFDWMLRNVSNGIVNKTKLFYQSQQSVVLNEFAWKHGYIIKQHLLHNGCNRIEIDSSQYNNFIYFN